MWPAETPYRVLTSFAHHWRDHIPDNVKLFATLEEAEKAFSAPLPRGANFRILDKCRGDKPIKIWRKRK